MQVFYWPYLQIRFGQPPYKMHSTLYPSLSYCVFRRVLVTLCVCTVRYTLFHAFSSSLISKFSRWLPGRVSNALVGLLTLRLPSHGWVSILLFNFLSVILIVGLPPKGWHPVPQCVSASVVCTPGGPLELICRSNLNTNLRAESYNELNRLSRITKAFPGGANS